MRNFSILVLTLLAGNLSVATAATDSAPTATVSQSAADAGKDVVHQLNNAFAKVFEVVAPSVVIIETTKKNDGSDNPALDDLFFNNQPDDNPPRRGQRDRQPVQSEGSGFIIRTDGHIL